MRDGKRMRAKTGGVKMLPQSGYFVADTDLGPTLAELRRKFISIFDTLARAHGQGPVTDDGGVERLYRTAKPVWVGAYDQLRFLPEIMASVAAPAFLDLAKRAGISFPTVSSKPVVRADMPGDDDWRFPPHQDYPYNKGSLNAITLWLPLQDTPEEAGALRVVPQSHTRGELPTKAPQFLLADPVPESDYVAAPMTCGQALVFSQFLIHKSGQNRTDRIRFSLQVRYSDLHDAEWVQRKFAFIKQ
jgi:hypothetical protein